jgi:hypothetical protein
LGVGGNTSAKPRPETAAQGHKPDAHQRHGNKQQYASRYPHSESLLFSGRPPDGEYGSGASIQIKLLLRQCVRDVTVSFQLVR